MKLKVLLIIVGVIGGMIYLNKYGVQSTRAQDKVDVLFNRVIEARDVARSTTTVQDARRNADQLRRVLKEVETVAKELEGQRVELRIKRELDRKMEQNVLPVLAELQKEIARIKSRPDLVAALGFTSPDL